MTLKEIVVSVSKEFVGTEKEIKARTKNSIMRFVRNVDIKELDKILDELKFGMQEDPNGKITAITLGAADPKQEESNEYLIAFLGNIFPILAISEQRKAQKLIDRMARFNQSSAMLTRGYTATQQFLDGLNVTDRTIQKKIEQMARKLSTDQTRIAASLINQSEITLSQQRLIEKQQAQLNNVSRRLVQYLEATGAALSPEESDKIRKDEYRPTDEIPDKIVFRTMNDDKVDDACLPFHEQEYDRDSDARPHLPLHHGCRCNYYDTEGNIIGQF